MEPNIRTNKINNSINNQICPKISHNTSLNSLYDKIVSMSRLMLLLLYAMRNEYICITIKISSRPVSLEIIGDQNFKSELERRI